MSSSNDNSPLEGNNNTNPSSRDTIDIHGDSERDKDPPEANTSAPLSPDICMREFNMRYRALLEKSINDALEVYLKKLEEFQQLILSDASEEELNSRRPWLEVVQKCISNRRVELLHLQNRP